MTAQRLRTDVISENIANVNTTRTAEGGTYRRKTVYFTEKYSNAFNNVLQGYMGVKGNGISGTGVRVSGIVEDYETEMNMVYDPSHPDADENGYVTYPNVNVVTEMTNLIDASRSYEANVTAFNAAKAMASKGLEVGK
jgi:flagellar basal-body rod protein FlgC